MTDKMPHNLTTKKTEYSDGETWEFYCPHCGYHIRYTCTYTEGDRILEVIDRGDPRATHYSPHMTSILLNGRLPEARPDEEECCGVEALPFIPEEEWLTPNLRAQIGKIMQQFNDFPNEQNQPGDDIQI